MTLAVYEERDALPQIMHACMADHIGSYHGTNHWLACGIGLFLWTCMLIPFTLKLSSNRR
jgi:hypothetical protein